MTSILEKTATVSAVTARKEGKGDVEAAVTEK